MPDFDEWDEDKNLINQEKHGVSFEKAQRAFDDPHRIIIRDLAHETGEQRFFCLGLVDGGVLTVRFSYPPQTHPDFRGRILAAREKTL